MEFHDIHVFKYLYFLLKGQTIQSRRARPVKRSKPLWGLSCGTGQPARSQTTGKEDADTRQKLMLHGMGRNKR